MSEIELRINGDAYTGWQRLSVVRSIETVSGRFEIEVTDKSPFPIPRSGAVELFLYGEKIISGYTDSIVPEITSDAHGLTITGRDKTGDLVDCSALVDSQELLKVTLREIIEDVISPFGISAIFKTDPAEVFKKFSFQEETAFEAIERACRLRGVFASSDADGNLVIQEYGAARAPAGLKIGENILSARAVLNEKDRFSTYYVYGQQPGDDNTSGESAAGPSGQANDLGVSRYRPKIIIAEGAVDAGLAQQRAEWEATVRAARAVSTEVTVQGWTADGGGLWRENRIARTYIPQNGIDGDMLIKEVSFSLDDKNGEKTRMILVRPDAYEKQPDLKEEENDYD